jgi:hypothetical protein
MPDPTFQDPELNLNEPIIGFNPDLINDLPNIQGPDLPPDDEIARTPVQQINQVAQPTPVNISANLAGADSPIAITYGEDRVLCLCYEFDNIPSSDIWVFAYVVGEGQIEQFKKLYVDGQVITITSLAEATDNAASGVGGGPVLGANGRIMFWTGTSSQNVSTVLSTYLSGYTDSLEDIAIIAIVMDHERVQGIPRVEVLIEGKDDIYDPRDLSTAYSNNNALVMRHFAVNYMQLSAGGTTYNTHADACDELLPAVTGNPRRTLNMTLYRPTPVEKIFQNMADHSGCFLFDTGSGYDLITDEASSSVLTIDEDLIVGDTTVTRVSSRNIPDDVCVMWTDRVDGTDKPAFAIGTSNSQKLSKVRLPGIDNYAQAKREAVERLNHYTLEDLLVTTTIKDDGIQLAVGDVVSITDPRVGLSAKEFRVTGLRNNNGRWLIRGREYQANAYSDVVETDPITYDTDLDNPLDPPAVPVQSVSFDDYIQGGTWIAEMNLESPSPLYIHIRDIVTEVWDTSEDNLLFSYIQKYSEIDGFPFSAGSDVFLYQQVPGADFKVRFAYITSAGFQGAFTSFTSVTVPSNFDPATVPSVNSLSADALPDDNREITFDYPTSLYHLYSRFEIELVENNGGTTIFKDTHQAAGATSYTSVSLDRDDYASVGKDDSMTTTVTAYNIDGSTSVTTDTWVWANS